MNIKWDDVKEDYARKDAEIARLSKLVKTMQASVYAVQPINEHTSVTYLEGFEQAVTDCLSALATVVIISEESKGG